MDSSDQQDLIVLTSPPASGKTYWISSLAHALAPTPVLVISPLRALADECLENWGERVTVMTPEEWLGRGHHAEVVIFDEFHLYFYWGDTFRPLMWEAFYALAYHAKLTFCLTATLSGPMREALVDFSCQFEESQWLDYGNQELKWKPETYVRAYSRRWLEDLVCEEERGQSVKLIFCRYRKEVFLWEKRLKSLGHTVISCVGGEAKEMRHKLLRLPFPDFIVCTTVLSHGVNLPRIEKIFFLYPVQNIDFWIQMVARGGRKGEAFEVYALENPWGIRWGFWTNLLAILRISFRMKVKQSLRPEWFLKD